MRVHTSLRDLRHTLALAIVISSAFACDDDVEPPKQTQAGQPSTVAGSGAAGGSEVLQDCPPPTPTIGAPCGQARSCQYPTLSYGVECREAEPVGNVWQYARTDTTPPCPAQRPEQDAPCPGEQRCRYVSNIDFCMIDPRIDAECDPDTHTWRVWQSICAQPQYHLTKCDPRAAWTLLLKHEAGDACDVLDQEHRFGLRQGDHGWVQVEGASAFGAFILEYGCELSFDIGWTTTKPGEDAHGGAKLRLVLEDGKLRGTYRASWGGSCSGEATGSVIGTRAGEHAEDADAGAQ